MSFRNFIKNWLEEIRLQTAFVKEINEQITRLRGTTNILFLTPEQIEAQSLLVGLRFSGNVRDRTAALKAYTDVADNISDLGMLREFARNFGNIGTLFDAGRANAMKEYAIHISTMFTAIGGVSSALNKVAYKGLGSGDLSAAANALMENLPSAALKALWIKALEQVGEGLHRVELLKNLLSLHDKANTQTALKAFNAGAQNMSDTEIINMASKFTFHFNAGLADTATVSQLMFSKGAQQLTLVLNSVVPGAERIELMTTLLSNPSQSERIILLNAYAKLLPKLTDPNAQLGLAHMVESLTTTDLQIQTLDAITQLIKFKLVSDVDLVAGLADTAAVALVIDPTVQTTLRALLEQAEVGTERLLLTAELMAPAPGIVVRTDAWRALLEVVLKMEQNTQNLTTLMHELAHLKQTIASVSLADGPALMLALQGAPSEAIMIVLRLYEALGVDLSTSGERLQAMQILSHQLQDTTAAVTLLERSWGGTLTVVQEATLNEVLSGMTGGVSRLLVAESIVKLGHTLASTVLLESFAYAQASGGLSQIDIVALWKFAADQPLDTLKAFAGLVGAGVALTPLIEGLPDTAALAALVDTAHLGALKQAMSTLAASNERVELAAALLVPGGEVINTGERNANIEAFNKMIAPFTADQRVSLAEATSNINSEFELQSLFTDVAYLLTRMSPAQMLSNLASNHAATLALLGNSDSTMRGSYEKLMLALPEGEPRWHVAVLLAQTYHTLSVQTLFNEKTTPAGHNINVRDSNDTTSEQFSRIAAALNTGLGKLSVQAKAAALHWLPAIASAQDMLALLHNPLRFDRVMAALGNNPQAERALLDHAVGLEVLLDKLGESVVIGGMTSASAMTSLLPDAIASRSLRTILGNTASGLDRILVASTLLAPRGGDFNGTSAQAIEGIVIAFEKLVSAGNVPSSTSSRVMTTNLWALLDGHEVLEMGHMLKDLLVLSARLPAGSNISALWNTSGSVTLMAEVLMPGANALVEERLVSLLGKAPAGAERIALAAQLLELVSDAQPLESLFSSHNDLVAALLSAAAKQGTAHPELTLAEVTTQMQGMMGSILALESSYSNKGLAITLLDGMTNPAAFVKIVLNGESTATKAQFSTMLGTAAVGEDRVVLAADLLHFMTSYRLEHTEIKISALLTKVSRFAKDHHMVLDNAVQILEHAHALYPDLHNNFQDMARAYWKAPSSHATPVMTTEWVNKVREEIDTHNGETKLENDPAAWLGELAKDESTNLISIQVATMDESTKFQFSCTEEAKNKGAFKDTSNLNIYHFNNSLSQWINNAAVENHFKDSMLGIMNKEGQAKIKLWNFTINSERVGDLFSIYDYENKAFNNLTNVYRSSTYITQSDAGTENSFYTLGGHLANDKDSKALLWGVQAKNFNNYQLSDLDDNLAIMGTVTVKSINLAGGKDNVTAISVHDLALTLTAEPTASKWKIADRRDTVKVSESYNVTVNSFDTSDITYHAVTGGTLNLRGIDKAFVDNSKDITVNSFNAFQYNDSKELLVNSYIEFDVVKTGTLNLAGNDKVTITNSYNTTVNSLGTAEITLTNVHDSTLTLQGINEDTATFKTSVNGTINAYKDVNIKIEESDFSTINLLAKATAKIELIASTHTVLNFGDGTTTTTVHDNGAPSTPVSPNEVDGPHSSLTAVLSGGGTHTFALESSSADIQFAFSSINNLTYGLLKESDHDYLQVADRTSKTTAKFMLDDMRSATSASGYDIANNTIISFKDATNHLAHIDLQDLVTFSTMGIHGDPGSYATMAVNNAFALSDAYYFMHAPAVLVA